VRGRTHRFSTRSEVADGACVLRGRIVLRLGGAEEDILGVSDLPVVGEHNVANALAAAVACRLVGCSTIAIADGLASYKALPHRLQNVGVLDEVAFYDDSKATNLDAAARAIQSFPPHTVHLILGGKDKGAHWPDLVPLVRRHARRVLLVGQAAERIRAAMEDAVPLVDCGTVEAAVRCGFEGARPGDVVLLAPGCASFDQYRNFEERGDDFRRAVEALLRDGGGRG
jgi:UDP-N-acetylmuramoylalanine--D-glutamate ligase